MRSWESERSCLVLNKLKLFATQIGQIYFWGDCEVKFESFVEVGSEDALPSPLKELPMLGINSFLKVKLQPGFMSRTKDDQFIAPPSQEIFKTPCLPYVFIDTVFLLYIRAMSQTMKSQKFLKALPKR